MKRIITIVLCLAMLLVGCGKKTPAETIASTPTATSSATTAADTTAATTPIPPRDPAYNVGEIRIGDVSLYEYKVVLPAEATEQEIFAADELIKYIELATGKTLEKAESADKAIYVGGYPDEALVNDGFDIKVVGDDLIISGSSDTGTLYGVYTFLEEYVGWRWLDGDYEVVKVSDFIQIPLDTNDRQVPQMWFRHAYWYDINQDFDYKAKMKNLQVSKNQQGSVYARGLFVHTFTSLIPAGKYYAEHPEWFTAHVEIERGEIASTQPCLTNPEVFEVVLASVREFLEVSPDAKIISVSQNDNQNYCSCENCHAVTVEEGSPMGPLLRFVNAIADEIKDEYPNVLVDTLAYQYSRTLPSITRPRDNVQIRLCGIECCYNHAINDSGCKINRKFMEDLKAWSEVSEHLAIWEYTTNFENYCAFHPNLEVLNDNMRTYAEHGADNIFDEGNNAGVSGEFGVLKTYLLAKLQWNPYMTEEEFQYHINDFLECYYGPGWQTVRDLLDRITANALEYSGHILAIGTGNNNPYYEFEPDEIEEIKKAWADARALALDDAQRLHFDRSYVSILMAEVAYYRYYDIYDKSYTQKAINLMEEIAAIAKPLGMAHCIDNAEAAW
ncbi:MAG: DUF4838 domain-containing protein [Clostridia bacterium]|nr:DUF4838 domain-containing protein [Clostridia bacterium]